MPINQEEKHDLLRRVPIFSELDSATLAAIADCATEMEFPAGHYVAREGEMGTGCFVIVKGRLRVVRKGETLAERGPGEVVGELSVLDHMPRVAHLVSEEPTTCLGLTSWDLNSLMDQHPRLSQHLLREMVRRVRALSTDQTY